MMNSGWFAWALLSAVFAALTAIFAKPGLAGIDSDMATLVRVVIILGVLGAFVGRRRRRAQHRTLSPASQLLWRRTGGTAQRACG